MNYYSDVVGYTGITYTTSLEKELETSKENLSKLEEEKELLKKLDTLGIDLDVLKRLLKKER